MKAAIWARVSTAEQTTAGQLAELRRWAAARGLDVAAEFVTEDSAWQTGRKGAEFERQRDALVNGARLGQYQVVLVWALDRLSRKGILDTLGTLRQLYDVGADVWSHQEPWLLTTEPRMRELLISFMAWMAEQESARKSERVKLAMQRPEVQANMAGRAKRGQDKRNKDGSKHERPTAGYSRAWTPGRRAALAERNRQRNAG
jgi:putative DNA-invertase from lambdoid prophage Rac